MKTALTQTEPESGAGSHTDQFLVTIQRAWLGPTPEDADLCAWAAEALRMLQGPAELCLRIVSEAEISFLNFRYRHRRGVTDVLSFPAEALPGISDPFLGDIAICGARVNQDASGSGDGRRKPPSDHHWAHVVIHGVLHLLGHDHEEEEEARIMKKLEVQALSAFAIPNPHVP